MNTERFLAVADILDAVNGGIQFDINQWTGRWCDNDTELEKASAQVARLFGLPGDSPQCPEVSCCIAGWGVADAYAKGEFSKAEVRGMRDAGIHDWIVAGGRAFGIEDYDDARLLFMPDAGFWAQHGLVENPDPEEGDATPYLLDPKLAAATLRGLANGTILLEAAE